MGDGDNSSWLSITYNNRVGIMVDIKFNIALPSVSTEHSDAPSFTFEDDVMIPVVSCHGVTVTATDDAVHLRPMTTSNIEQTIWHIPVPKDNIPELIEVLRSVAGISNPDTVLTIPRVVIDMTGGMINSVDSTHNLEVLLIDYDDMSNFNAQIPQLSTGQFQFTWACLQNTEIQPTTVNWFIDNLHFLPDPFDWQGQTDNTGKPCGVRRYFTCTQCEYNWENDWSSASNDSCPHCNISIFPTDTDRLNVKGEVIPKQVDFPKQKV